MLPILSVDAHGRLERLTNSRNLAFGVPVDIKIDNSCPRAAIGTEVQILARKAQLFHYIAKSCNTKGALIMIYVRITDISMSSNTDNISLALRYEFHFH